MKAERRTQERIVKLFIDALHYAYLGNFSEGDHDNIIPGELEHFLALIQGYAELEDGDTLVRRAVDDVVKVAGNTSLSPYDRNRAVHNLLRYGDRRGRADRDCVAHRLEGARAQSLCDRGRGHGQSHALMDKHLPHWRHTRRVLNAAPLAHEEWEY